MSKVYLTPKAMNTARTGVITDKRPVYHTRTCYTVEDYKMLEIDMNAFLQLPYKQLLRPCLLCAGFCEGYFNQGRFEKDEFEDYTKLIAEAQKYL